MSANAAGRGRRAGAGRGPDGALGSCERGRPRV